MTTVVAFKFCHDQFRFCYKKLRVTSKDIPHSSRAKRSDVWSVFRKVIVEGKEKAKCSLCERTFAYNGSTTSNLKDHIEWDKRTTAQLNPGLGSSSAEKKQITLLDVFSPTAIRPCSVAKANGITDRLARRVLA